MAEQLCMGFVYHDERDRRAAIESFAFVDSRQFPDVSDEVGCSIAGAYVDALWAKDDLERDHLDASGTIDPESIATADWEPVRAALRRRAEAAGMAERYAEYTTTAWKRHKTGGDYWTPFMNAQRVELAAAFGDTSLPGKPKEGRSGYGPLPVRYVLGVELHDMHTRESWQEAIDVMTPYFEAILIAHERSATSL